MISTKRIKKGNTPLCELLSFISSAHPDMVKPQHIDLVKFLVSRGASLNARNHCGYNAIDMVLYADKNKILNDSLCGSISLLDSIVESRKRYHGIRTECATELKPYVKSTQNTSCEDVEFGIYGGVLSTKINNGALKSSDLLNSQFCKKHNFKSVKFEFSNSDKGYVQGVGGKRNYVVTDGSIKLKVSWQPVRPKGDKRQLVNVIIHSDGSISLSDEDAKKYGVNGEKINFDRCKIFVGGLSLKDALASGRWRERIFDLGEERQRSASVESLDSEERSDDDSPPQGTLDQEDVQSQSAGAGLFSDQVLSASASETSDVKNVASTSMSSQLTSAMSQSDSILSVVTPSGNSKLESATRHIDRSVVGQESTSFIDEAYGHGVGKSTGYHATSEIQASGVLSGQLDVGSGASVTVVEEISDDEMRSPQLLQQDVQSQSVGGLLFSGQVFPSFASETSDVTCIDATSMSLEPTAGMPGPSDGLDVAVQSSDGELKSTTRHTDGSVSGQKSTTNRFIDAVRRKVSERGGREDTWYPTTHQAQTNDDKFMQSKSVVTSSSPCESAKRKRSRSLPEILDQNILCGNGGREYSMSHRAHKAQESSPGRSTSSCDLEGGESSSPHDIRREILALSKCGWLPSGTLAQHKHNLVSRSLPGLPLSSAGISTSSDIGVVGDSIEQIAQGLLGMRSGEALDSDKLHTLSPPPSPSISPDDKSKPR
ncbi:MAG: hypothetical protein ACTJLM_05245 [Ehrlichia sp.]